MAPTIDHLKQVNEAADPTVKSLVTKIEQAQQMAIMDPDRMAHFLDLLKQQAQMTVTLNSMSRQLLQSLVNADTS